MHPTRPSSSIGSFGALALILVLAAAGSARAVIINVDAQADAIDSPISMAFGAGNWTITPTNPTLEPGAAFTAWSAWSSGALWLNWVTIYDMNAATYHNFGAAGPGVSGSYASPGDAFAAISSQAISITLSTPGVLQFFVGDNIPGDNRGGMSLEVNAAVAESGSLAALVGFGLLLMAAARIRIPGSR